MRSKKPRSGLVEEITALEKSGDISAALQKARQALHQARKRARPDAVAAALVSMAHIRMRLGQYHEGQTLAQEALQTATPESPMVADALQTLANCAGGLGRLSEAEHYFRQAAELCREINYRMGRMAALHGLAAGVYMPRGLFDLALAADEEVCAMLDESGQPELKVFPLISLAMVCQYSGERARGREAIEELGRRVVIGSMQHGYYFCLLGNQALEDGQIDRARDLFLKAHSIAEESGETWLNANSRLGMSRCCRLLGDLAQALHWASEAELFSSKANSLLERGKARLEKGRIAWLKGDADAAEAEFRAAIADLDRVEAVYELARAKFLWAAFLHQQVRPEAAEAWVDAGKSILNGGFTYILEQERILAFNLMASYQGGTRSANDHPADASAVSAALLESLQRFPPQPLHATLLGGFEVKRGGINVERRMLSQRRAGELLALLWLTPGHALPLDQVAEALWPEKPFDSIQVAFHHATSTLRRALEPDLPEKFTSRYLDVEEQRVSLRPPPGSAGDADAFEAECSLNHWEPALALYKGDLLPEFLYAGWTTPLRIRLNLLYQRALLGAAEERLAQLRYEDCLDACRRLLELEPWQEQAVWLAMHACAALNDRAGARRIYLALEKTLDEELGRAPQEELKAFFDNL